MIPIQLRIGLLIGLHAPMRLTKFLEYLMDLRANYNRRISYVIVKKTMF